MEARIGDDIILIGTAHVSDKSVAEVKEAIEKYKPAVVGVELDEARYNELWMKVNQAKGLKILDTYRERNRGE